MDVFKIENWLKENLLTIQRRVLYIDHICNYLNIERSFVGFKNPDSILIWEDVERIGNNWVYPTCSSKWNGINNILIKKSNMLNIDFLEDIFLETNNQHVLHAIHHKLSRMPTNSNNGGNSYEPLYSVPEHNLVYFIERKSTLSEINKRIQNKDASILVIYGMPGIGKTLLLSKLLNKITEDQIKWIDTQTPEKLTEMLENFYNFHNPKCTLVLDHVGFDIISQEHNSIVSSSDNQKLAHSEPGGGKAIPYKICLSQLKCARPIIILSNISPGTKHENKIKISKMSNQEMKELHKSFNLSEQNKEDMLEKLGNNLDYHPRSLFEAFTLCQLGMKIEDIIEIILLEPKMFIKRTRDSTIFDSFAEIIDNLQSEITKTILPYFGIRNSNDIPNSVLYTILELEYQKSNNFTENIGQSNFNKIKAAGFRVEVVENLDSICLLEGEKTSDKFRIHSILRSVLSVKYLDLKTNLLTDLRNFFEEKAIADATEKLALSQIQNEHKNIVDISGYGKIPELKPLLRNNE